MNDMNIKISNVMYNNQKMVLLYSRIEKNISSVVIVKFNLVILCIYSKCRYCGGTKMKNIY